MDHQDTEKFLPENEVFKIFYETSYNQDNYFGRRWQKKRWSQRKNWNAFKLLMKCFENQRPVFESPYFIIETTELIEQHLHRKLTFCYFQSVQNENFTQKDKNKKDIEI